MIFGIGTPVNARFRPWSYDWTIKPDALMISAIDFLKSRTLFQKVKEIGICEYLNWDNQIICDSGAFSALNRKNKIEIDLENLKDIYRELTLQDPSIIKITLDFPDNKIVDNYKELFPLEVQPVIPHDKFESHLDCIINEGFPDWIFIGRLVPLMRRGGGHAARLIPVLDRVRTYIQDIKIDNKIKIWALGVGAPSLIRTLKTRVDGCDSARWRITGSNMVLLPQGGERGVGNRTKWRGTHHRINDGREKELVVNILREIDTKSGGLEHLDSSLGLKCIPKQLKGQVEYNLPTIGFLINKLRSNEKDLSVYELELLLRSSGNLRLVFNYWAALSFKIQSDSGDNDKTKIPLESYLKQN